MFSWLCRLEKCVLRGRHPRHGRPPLERRDRSARLGRAHTAQDWCSLLSTPRAVPKHRLGVRALYCALQVPHLSSCFLFWPRQLSFWRWRPLQAGDRGTASCGASAPTQSPSATEGSLRRFPRCVPAARRVAEVSPRGSEFASFLGCKVGACASLPPIHDMLILLKCLYVHG